MLPKAWVAETLGNCSDSIQYGLTATSSPNGNGHRYIRITDLQDRQIIWSQVPFADADTEKCESYKVLPEDILFARTGATVGKSHLVREVPYPATFASYLIRVRCDQRVLSPSFAGWFFQSPSYWSQILEGAEGTGQPNFNGSKLSQLDVPLPPLAEQNRIVAKLDTLTARLVQARAELDRVPILVKLLKRQAMERCFSNSAIGNLVTLGTRLRGVEAGKNMRCEERPPKPGERGVVKVSAVTWGRFDATKSKTLPDGYEPPEIARIRAGDLLISRANTLELVGAVAIVEENPENLFLSDKILRLLVADSDKKWILWFLRSPNGRQQIEQLATGNQLSMRNISQDALRRIELPFPDQAKRDELIATMEAAFSRADRLEAKAARARALLDRLEASILTKAFRGELVPQDAAN